MPSDEIQVVLPKKAFNEPYIEYLKDESRYLVFYGGA